jgi:autotransporter-associated beta strand protein
MEEFDDKLYKDPVKVKQGVVAKFTSDAGGAFSIKPEIEESGISDTIELTKEGDMGMFSVLGLPFFRRNSVMFDVENVTTSYSPFYIIDTPLATGAAGTAFTVTPDMGQLGLAGVISGAGGFSVADQGVANLSATNSYTGKTSIAKGGWLGIAGPGSIAASAGVANDGTFDISYVDAAVPVTSLSGSGKVALGSKALVVTNANDSFSGAITDGGDSGETGGMLFMAGGKETLSGVNSYTGLTFVAKGATLALAGGGGIASSASVNTSGSFDISGANAAKIKSLDGDGAVALGSKQLELTNASGSFSGAISDGSSFATDGKVTKAASGGLLLSGGFQKLTGTSNYTGATTVSGGMLIVNGTLANSAVTVAGASASAPSAIGGTGVLYRLNVGNNGVLLPGDPTLNSGVGTLLIKDTLTLQTGSTFQVTGLNNMAQYSQVIVGGAATIQSGAKFFLRADSPYWQYNALATVLTAGEGVSGTFGSVSSNLALLSPVLAYNKATAYAPATVTLSFVSSGKTIADFTKTANQTSAANSLWKLLFPQLGSGASPGPLFNSLFGASAEGLERSLDSLTGETHNSLASTVVSDSRYVRDALMARTLPTSLSFSRPGDAGGTGVAEYMAYDGMVSWSQTLPGSSENGRTANAAGTRSSVKGVINGLDKRWKSGMQIGTAFGYTNSDMALGQKGADAGARSYHVGAYASYEDGGAKFSMGGIWARHHLNESRSARVNSYSDSLSARYNGTTLQAFGEVGRVFEAKGLVYEPYANITHIAFASDQFSELGHEAALSGSVHQELTSSTLGVRGAATLAKHLGKPSLTGQFNLGWRHDLANSGAYAVLRFAGSDPFVTRGSVVGGDAALIDAGLNFMANKKFGLSLTYGGQYAAHYQDHSMRAGMQWHF